jgi:hypothetical protein
MTRTLGTVLFYVGATVCGLIVALLCVLSFVFIVPYLNG